jgi:hypothetical protein
MRTFFHRTFVAAAGALLTAGELAAHPGHGTTAPESVEHYVFEPLHAAPVIALLAGCALAVVIRKRRRSS